jgi:hypothetical protein
MQLRFTSVDLDAFEVSECGELDPILAGIGGVDAADTRRRRSIVDV